MAQNMTADSLATPTTPAGGATLASASTVLAVENMHCGGCLRKVESALGAINGVSLARANLSQRRVTILHDRAKADVAAMIDALQAVGFRSAELAAAKPSCDPAKSERDVLRYLAVAGFAAANIMLLSVSVWSGTHGDMPPALQSLFHWLSAAIALPAVAYAGQPFFRSALAALRARRVNMDVPISLGVTLATGMSVYQTIRGTEQVYFDAAITLLFFLLIGRALDSHMRSRATSAAGNLLGLRASVATVVDNNGELKRVSANRIVPGMLIATAAGERFAVDGRIVSGSTDVDESLITGETHPRAITPGDGVYAGTVNLGQPVQLEALATGESTLVAEIARLMLAAEQGRASYVRLADRAARYYAPAVHVLGLATFIGWMALGHGWEPALTAAIAVLIITCPCALALAVPAVQVAATSRLFAQGILIKSPDALERIAEIDTIVLDKTGTITLGEPELANAASISTEIFGRAATLAASSRHPYARAVVVAARERGIRIVTAAGISETAGLGISRQTSVGQERLGSARWCNVSAAQQASLWYTAPDTGPIGFIFRDGLRSDASAVVAALGRAHFPVELLSGDTQAEVSRIARETGISSYHAGVLPAGKLEHLAELALRGAKVLMVGDGLNDAPALAGAHASISPASAADISQSAADVIFQGASLEPVLETIAVAREAQRMAMQNFALALGYNLIFVPLAVIGLVTPLIAAIAMSASSVAVTSNAVRLQSKRLELPKRRTAP